jgi:hypothetical protein
VGIETIPATSKIIEIEETVLLITLLLIIAQKVLAIIRFPVQEIIVLTTSKSRNGKGEKGKNVKEGRERHELSKNKEED